MVKMVSLTHPGCIVSMCLCSDDDVSMPVTLQICLCFRNGGTAVAAVIVVEAAVAVGEMVATVVREMLQ